MRQVLYDLDGADLMHALERRISEQRFFGFELGVMLTDVIYIELICGGGTWGLGASWKDFLRCIRYFALPIGGKGSPRSLPPGRVLVTCMSGTYRMAELILPVVRQLGENKCIIMADKRDVLTMAPPGSETIMADDVMQFRHHVWRAEFWRCWPVWRDRLTEICQSYRLPRGALVRLALNIMLGSQRISGFLTFLDHYRPAAILTEYDRNHIWSALVLAARAKGIPTFTMVHGVPSAQSHEGYVPIVADKVICWGELSKGVFVSAGVPPENILICGCPRLNRELSATPAQGRTKLGIDVHKPVAMMGTAPIHCDEFLQLVEMFCRATERIEGISALVRLHPSEQLDTYSAIARRHPSVHFFANSEASLDESLAAADVIVVQSSSLGSDALVKGRLSIVIDTPGLRLGPAQDLIERAHCPCATTEDGLVTELRRLLFNAAARREQLVAAERYVRELCAAFGQDSASRIADTISVAASSAFTNRVVLP